MPLSPTNGVPLQIEAGNSAAFLLSYANFAPGSYTLIFTISQGSAAPISITATTSGTKFLVTLSTTVSATLLPGNWPWYAYASATGVRYGADAGVITVLPNLAAAQTPSFAQAQVTRLETVLATFTATDKKEVDFQGQKFVRADIAQYRKEYTYYRAIVVSEQTTLARSLGGGDPTRVATVFVPAAPAASSWPFPYPPSS